MKVIRRGISAVLLICACLLTSGCTHREIRSPADELCMYRWGAEMENGNFIDLSVDDSTAAFSVKNNAYSLLISGVYMLDDSTLVIHDDRTHRNFSFTYLLHGDSLELTYGDGTVYLKKK